MATNEPILLRSERLAVEISRPGVAYAGTRFDWSGFVTQVSLDGQHTFCVPEDYTPGKGTGGIGICNEFGIDLPIGYTDSSPGECFPKLGIGLLTRLDKPDYSFWYPHKIVESFPIDIEAGTDTVTFTVQPVDCRGYAARLTKRLSVRQNDLYIAYTLQNTGDHLIHTNEYVHNFIGIDKHDLGPAYSLHFQHPVNYEDVMPLYLSQIPGWIKRLLPFMVEPLAQRLMDSRYANLNVTGSQMSWHETPQTPFYCRLATFDRSDLPQWELRHEPSGVTMREYVDFKPTRIAVWGTTHVISVEVFVDIHLAPGEEQRWNRHFQFLSGEDEA